MITEEVKTKAKEFAINALQGQIDALADAYLKGYEDAMAAMPHEPIVEECDTFIDLMLDSGTMWTEIVHRLSNGYQSLGYYAALRYGLPTLEQFEEMLANCRRIGDYHLVGRNSKKIYMPTNFGGTIVWIKSEVVNDEALAYKITKDGPELVRMFTGTELPFFRVKNKNEQ